MGYTRILSIDGGGIRGIIPATILVYLEKRLQEYTSNSDVRLADYFDLISGTSTGGLLTSLYLKPNHTSPSRPQFSADDALKLYFDHGREIFHPSVKQFFKSFGGLIGPKYNAISFEKLLDHYLGDTLLSELLKPCLITAYNVSCKTATFFNQLDPNKPYKDDFFIKDIARATSAAPTFFPAAQIASYEGSSYLFVDGGTFANNPAVCALVEASKLPTHPHTQEMLILSLGTGTCSSHFKTKSLRNGGAIHWALPMFNIFTEGICETVDVQMRTLFSSQYLKNQYLRIQPDLCQLGYPDLPMDAVDSESLMLLQEIGLKLTDLYKSKLDTFAKLLIAVS